MIQISKKRLTPRKFVLILMDLLISVLAIWVAVQLNHETSFDFLSRRLFSSSLTLAGSALIVYYSFGFYDQMWRFASVKQHMRLFWGTLIQTVIAYSYMRLRSEAFAMPVYVIYFMTTFILTTSIRVAYRLVVSNESSNHFIDRYLSKLGGKSDDLPKHLAPLRRRVIVIGAGVTGSQLIREMQQHNDRYEPVALIDDNPLTHTYKVLGVLVHGNRDTIPEAVSRYKADSILLAIPNASKETIRELIQICSKTECELKTVPMLQDLIGGRVSINDIKSVGVEDLLGRDEVVLDTQAITSYLKDEVVLVTGGGSIGSELCRQIARFRPKQLIVFDIYENNVYQLQYELKGMFGDSLNLIVLIGSVRDKQRLQDIFDQYHPNVVFHAAAHNLVPLMETCPGEAVKNNIMGMFNVARTAADYQAKRFVLISSDQAFNPTHVLGATKRIAELLVQSLNAQYSLTRFAAVRFGNVLSSNYGVIPLFKQQIKNQRCVTLAHPEITCFFMTISMAAQLIMQAGAMTEGGEIFTLDKGKPMNLDDLARDLIRLSGLEPETDVQITYTGLKSGEMLIEKPFHDQEKTDPTKHHQIFTVKTVQGRQVLTQEIAALNGIIQWESESLNDLMRWMIEHSPVGVASREIESDTPPAPPVPGTESERTGA